MAGRFAEGDVARDDGFVDEVFKYAPDLFDHEPREVGTPVVHGHEDAFDGDVWIDSGGTNSFVEVDDFCQSLEAVVLALDGDEQAIGGGEGAGHENPE